jgi:hypothetical protein
MNVGVAIEGEDEMTLDFGYSWSDATAESTIYGSTTVASVSVLMQPNDITCATLTTVLTRVKTTATASE